MLSDYEIAWIRQKLDASVTRFIMENIGRSRDAGTVLGTGAFVLSESEYSYAANQGKAVGYKKLLEVARALKILGCNAKVNKCENVASGMSINYSFNIRDVRLTEMQNKHLETLRNIDKKNKNGEQDELSELVEAVRERISSYAEKSNEEIQQLILDFQKKLKK